MNKLKLIYVYDAHCSWCFAFSKVILAIQEKYQQAFDFEVLSGGMVVGDRIGPIRDALEVDDQQLYESLATEFGLDGAKFYEQMQLPEVMESARYEFALAKQLQVTGYPQLLVQTDETHFKRKYPYLADSTLTKLSVN